MTQLTLAKAIGAGIRAAMEDDPKVIVMGEDVGTLGGVFRVTEGLAKDFGESRVVDTPLAESGILGTAVGLAYRGYRPVCEIQFDGFVFPAYDQIISQVAKVYYRTAGRVPMPVTIRIPFAGGIGAVEHHSESPETLFAHIPGLRVVSPANPSDGFHLMRQAIACPDPVVFLEPKRRYWEKGEVDPAATPLGMQQAAVVRPGTDLTLIAYGPQVRTALDAAQVAASEGRSLEVVDLRSISPIDLPTLTESVSRTGRAVIVHEAPRSFGPGAELAASISQECFYSLEAPVLRVTGYDVPFPPSKVEDLYLPDVDRVLEAVDRSLEY